METVKRLTCDGSLITIVEDDRGMPLDVGRKRRVASTALKRALWSRDRACTFPGCHNKRFVDAHHIEHWADGGDTSLENLTLLCTYHHRLLHEGGFRIRRDQSDAIYFQRADGRAIPRGGYRAEDMLDDAPGVGGTDNPSAEGLMAAIVHGRRDAAEALLVELGRGGSVSADAWAAPSERSANPSAEVREARGVYRVCTTRVASSPRVMHGGCH